eukprot:XP_014785469.1 PREDICTED: retinol dehydrogenase 10-B-like [Octopus bimaculoides]
MVAAANSENQMPQMANNIHTEAANCTENNVSTTANQVNSEDGNNTDTNANFWSYMALGWDCVKNEIGNVDILVNNAGIVTGKNLLDCTDQDIIKTMQVNVLAHFWTIKAFLPKMIERNSGHIVTISSTAGVIGVNKLTGYCASKFACVGLDEALRSELSSLKKDGVHMTLACPYYTNTGMFLGAKTR